MSVKYVLLVVGLCLCRADKDDKKWVWNENNRNPNERSSRSGLELQSDKSRYNVFEEPEDYLPESSNLFHPNGPTLALSQRPPSYQGIPPGAVGAGLLGQRPGGLYEGGAFQPNYGGQRPYTPNLDNSQVLTGPIPSFVKEGPFKNFDKCKCAEKFNCNSPGISYGHCDVGKQYCCYSSKKDIGGPLPAKPVHSIENGILVGPGGPLDPIPGANSYPRPPKQVGAGFYRPGPAGFQGQPGSFGVGGYREPNEYSADNGILVGPGGPHGAPAFGLGRSANTKRAADKL